MRNILLVALSFCSVVYVKGFITSYESCGNVQRGCKHPAATINGGSQSCSEAAPWNVLLADRRDQKSDSDVVDGFCGGSLVNNEAGDKTFVITAAHCIHYNRNSEGTCP